MRKDRLQDVSGLWFLLLSWIIINNVSLHHIFRFDMTAKQIEYAVSVIRRLLPAGYFYAPNTVH